MAGTFFWGNRNWGPGDKAAFAKYLRTHGGINYNAWARNHPAAARLLSGGRVSGPAAPPPPDPYTTASTQAQSETQAEIDAINRERERAAESSQRSMTNMQGFYKALAGMLGSIGPTTAGIYQNAAGTEGAIGKGFADAQAAIQSGEANDMSGFLNLIGAPTEQVSQVLEKVGGPGAADVVYGLGGAIPATALNREGAAFSAAAAHLPAQAAGQGIENLRMLSSDFAKTNSGFDDEVSSILDKLPQRTQDILQQIMENDRAERALRLQEGYYGQSALKTSAELTGTLPDGSPTYSAKQDAAAKATKAKQAQQKKIQEREAAFARARQDIFHQAKSLVVPMTMDDKVAWVAAHPGKTFADAPNRRTVNYAAAKKALFDQYKDLLRYATAAGKAALKRRLNQMIDEALAAAGIHPSAAPSRAGYTLIRPNPIPGRGD